MSCSTKKKSTSASDSCNFEDGSATCGKVPETYKFNCPAGEKCVNNNPSEKKEEEPPRPIRRMPKTECSNYSCQADPEILRKKKEKDCPPPKVGIEDNPPPITTKLPDTKGFKCQDFNDLDKPEMKRNSDKSGEKPKEAECKDDKKPEAAPTPAEEVKKAEDCRECGAPVPGKPCNCNRPMPPVPTPPSCKGPAGHLCGPNTSCEVVPLTMKVKK